MNNDGIINEKDVLQSISSVKGGSKKLYTMKNNILSEEKINWKIISDPLLDAFSPQFSLLLNLLSKKKDEKDNEIERYLVSPANKHKIDNIGKPKPKTFNFQIKLHQASSKQLIDDIILRAKIIRRNRKHSKKRSKSEFRIPDYFYDYLKYLELSNKQRRKSCKCKNCKREIRLIDMIDSDEDSIIMKNHIAMKENEKSYQSSLRSSPKTNSRKHIKVRRLNSITANYILFSSKLKDGIKKIYHRVSTGRTINTLKSKKNLNSFTTFTNQLNGLETPYIDSSKLKIDSEILKSFKTFRKEEISSNSQNEKITSNKNININKNNNYSLFLRNQIHSEEKIEKPKKSDKKSYQKILVNRNTKNSYKNIKLAYSLNVKKDKSNLFRINDTPLLPKINLLKYWTEKVRECYSNSLVRLFNKKRK